MCTVRQCTDVNYLCSSDLLPTGLATTQAQSSFATPLSPLSTIPTTQTAPSIPLLNPPPPPGMAQFSMGLTSLPPPLSSQAMPSPLITLPPPPQPTGQPKLPSQVVQAAGQPKSPSQMVQATGQPKPKPSAQITNDPFAGLGILTSPPVSSATPVDPLAVLDSTFVPLDSIQTGG